MVKSKSMHGFMRLMVRGNSMHGTVSVAACAHYAESAACAVRVAVSSGPGLGLCVLGWLDLEPLIEGALLV